MKEGKEDEKKKEEGGGGRDKCRARKIDRKRERERRKRKDRPPDLQFWPPPIRTFSRGKRTELGNSKHGKMSRANGRKIWENYTENTYGVPNSAKKAATADTQNRPAGLGCCSTN